jgi:hypothetical protein
MGSMVNDGYLQESVMVPTGRYNYINGQCAGLEEVINGPSWGGGELEVPSSGCDTQIG